MTASALHFGWLDIPDKVDEVLDGMPKSKREFATAAKPIHGSWDRKTPRSLWKVYRDYFKKELPAQRQTRGTCVSRGYSGSANVVQVVQIAVQGKLEEFKPVSHAPIYGGSRQLAGIRSGDGAIGATAAKWVNTKGLSHQGETPCNDYYSDTVAVQYGSRGVPAEIAALGADNLIKEVTRVTSFDQCCDIIWNGGAVAVCSSRGFTMTRDSQGFCSPSGTWMHCMYFAAIIVAGSRLGLGCGQSWGQNTPKGPLLPDCPDYVFGVDAKVVDGMCNPRSGGDTWGLYAIEGWKGQAEAIDWLF